MPRASAMNNAYYEVAVRYMNAQIGAEEALREVLYHFGFDDTSLAVLSEGPFSYLKVYCNTKSESAALAKRIKDLSLHGIEVLIRKLGVVEWRDKWKEDLKSFHLTKHIDVVPAWNANQYRSRGRKPIFLDTTLAFGTGLHETTHFSAQLIERCAGKFQTFLDIGTGTGILTMTALHCGAKELWAVDIDEGSIRTAQQNLARNNLSFDWCRVMDFRKFRRKKQFDLVAANVITDELIAMKSKIVSAVAPKKYLILSGISLDNLVRLKKEFKTEPLRCLRILKGKKWCAVLYKKLTKD